MMRYIPTDKYTVAWFKLAECVAKGEKEKALGVYRLLMHSIEDKAYAHQLEGDLLGAFQDERALEKYEHAAQLYVSHNKWKEAIALYEELTLRLDDNSRALRALLDLYRKHKKTEQYAVRIIDLLGRFCLKNRFSHLELLVNALPATVLSEQETKECTTSCIALISKSNVDNKLKERLLEKTLDYLTALNTGTMMTSFLLSLEHSYPTWYSYAQDYLMLNKTVCSN